MWAPASRRNVEGIDDETISKRVAPSSGKVCNPPGAPQTFEPDRHGAKTFPPGDTNEGWAVECDRGRQEQRDSLSASLTMWVDDGAPPHPTARW